MLKRASVADKMRENYLPQDMRHCLARAAAEVGPIDNKSGRCDLPSFPRFLSAQLRTQCAARVWGDGIPAEKRPVLQVNQISEQPRPSIHIDNNSTQHFPTQPTYLLPAHCHLQLTVCAADPSLNIAIAAMSVDAQGPPNDQDGCAPPNDKSAEHEAAEHGEAQHDAATHDATTAEIEEVPPPKPQPKLCGICEKQEGKYKCPRCSIP